MIFLIPAWILASSSFALGAETISLKQAFESALTRTETTGIQDLLAEEAAERVKQARGGILPTLALNASYTRQDEPPSRTSASGVSSAQASDQRSIRITATQPLFRGLREFAALRAARGTGSAQEATARSSRLQVYSTVGAAFYALAAAEQDIRNLRTLLDVSERRVKELEGRVRIGRSRRAELYSGQSQVASARAAIQAAEGSLEQARDLFAYATGLDRATSVDPAAVAPEKMPEISLFLSELEARPDVEAQRTLLEVSEEGVSVAKGAHLPSVDFTGNYYLNRTGILEPVKWDVGFTLSFPIFQGGITSSQVREARLREQGQHLSLSQARRSAQREIQSAYRAVESALEQIESLKAASATAERNYEAQSADYKLGLVTNLDVIQSLNAFIESRRAHDRVRFQAQSAWVDLQAASGKLPQ